MRRAEVKGKTTERKPTLDWTDGRLWDLWYSDYKDKLAARFSQTALGSHSGPDDDSRQEDRWP